MTAISLTNHSPATVISTILRVIKDKLIPLLRDSGKEGNMPFGASILTKDDLDPFTVSVNQSRDSRLLHGETNCIREFYECPEATRPEPSSCIFFATHEPCSLCLSGIAWCGFPTVYHLFTYEETRDLLGMAGDIDILKEVFRVRAPCDTDASLEERPLYNRENKYFAIKSIGEYADEIEDETEREQVRKEIRRVKSLFDELSKPWKGQ
jgi:tRNA(Arg) A34 adenosine deaminase TadA